MTRVSTYTQFQNLQASEKECLVIVEASKRLMGWVLHSGSIYKLTGFTIAVFAPTAPVQDSGVALTEVASVGACTAGKFYLDRTNQILYLRTSDSANPNGKFIGLTYRMFFSRAGRNLAHDLSTGFPVHWEPMVEGTSDFGAELDNTNQLGQAIEGEGTVTFYNDQDFWGPIYDKVYFENQRVMVYSWSPLIPVSEAKLIYRGRIQQKHWSPADISFDLKDVFNELATPVNVPFIKDYGSAFRVPDAFNFARQRRLYGYVFGHIPTNIDQVLTGYPITGSVIPTQGLATITGSGTSFLAQLSPNDQLLVGVDTSPVTVKSVDSNTQITLTEVYPNQSQSAVTCLVNPSAQRRYMNRNFLIAGHALREPSTTVVTGYKPNAFTAADLTDLLAGDPILVNGEASTIARVSGSKIFLSTNLSANPSGSQTVVRPAVSSVYLDNRKLDLTRDYTYSASAGTLTLNSLAEFNIAAVLSVTGTVTITNGSRAVTGSGTLFTKQFKESDWIAAFGQTDYFEVLSVESDTAMTLRAVATYTASGAVGKRKSPSYYQEGSSVLSLDSLGSTVEGTTSGTFAKTAAGIVKHLLGLADVTDSLNAASFTTAAQVAPERIGLAIPSAVASTDVPTYRDVINQINQSVFGTLIQDTSFELNYSILSPKRPAALAEFVEADILDIAVDSDSQRLVSTSKVKYLFKEYDPTSKAGISSEASASSDVATYLAQSNKEFGIDTLLIDSRDAQIYANRWAFIFEVSSSVLKIRTKMKASLLQINDVVSIKHEKLFQRVGSTESRKIAAVQMAKRTAMGSSISLEDLSNAFSRCAIITAGAASDWDSASAGEKLVNGYITDAYGMIGNDADTFGINVIW